MTIENFKTGVKKNSPEILTGLGIVLGVGAAISAVKATPRYERILDDRKNNKRDLGYGISKKEHGLLILKHYGVSILMGIGATACFIGSLKINKDRVIASATAASIASTAYSHLRDQTIKHVGEESMNKIDEKITKDQIQSTPTNQQLVMSSGDIRCYDTYSGREFISNGDKIRAAKNKLDEQLFMNDFVSLNEFYDMVNLKPLYPLGSEYGWSVEDGLLDIDMTSILIDEIPYLAVTFNKHPKSSFYKFG